MNLYNNKPKLKPLRRKLRKDSTHAERVVWNLVRNRQIMNLKFFRQYGIGDYIIDFYCPEIALAIEIDGGQHDEIQTRIKDKERTGYLRKFGIQLLRFWNSEALTNVEGLYKKITDKIS